jgi:hypothetical protein
MAFFIRNTDDPEDPYLYCGGCGSAVCTCDQTPRQVRTELEQHAWSCREERTSGGDRR